ncbi:MAG: hypothetical protein IPM45_10080 [Acidimicrobiales bacterium]|nr:hypothetical protein [Acidimicrobiales bacterium]
MSSALSTMVASQRARAIASMTAPLVDASKSGGHRTSIQTLTMSSTSDV